MWGCGYSQKHIEFEGDQMVLKFSNETCVGEGKNTDCLDRDYGCSEIHSNDKFTYGYFGAEIKVPKEFFGSVVSFFLYSRETADEIDIEFSGKDDSKLFTTTYHLQGKYGIDNLIYHSIEDISPGSNAQEEFHEYGITWLPNCIVWWMDSIEVRRVCKENENDLPTFPSQIMMNFWNGKNNETTGISFDGWLGILNYQKPVLYPIRRIRYYSIEEIPMELKGDIDSNYSSRNKIIFGIVAFIFVLLWKDF